MLWSSSILFPLCSCVLAVFCLPMFIQPSIVLNFDIFSDLGLSMTLMVDIVSMVFFSTVSMVASLVMIYSLGYMSFQLSKKKFMITMMIFILSMFILSFSADLFWLMVGWDGLGLSSFYLIVFFQNWKSLNSAMVTFLSNRTGDGFILISLGWALSSSAKGFLYDSPLYLMILLMFGAFSKSAQIPFSAWLPLAMAAPTPVSSLVHSSTLVTAGVFLLIRFNKFFVDIYWVMTILAALTIMMAGMSSVGEFDSKKVVALSTLSHIGLMIFFVSIGANSGAILHLVTHAFFKSLLFMVVGLIIHESLNYQDLRKLSLSGLPYQLSVCFVLSLVSMMGLPFLAGFVSKEALLLYLTSDGNAMMVLLFGFSVCLTSSYSIRIFMFMNHTPSVDKLMKVPTNWINWGVLFFSTNFSIYMGAVASGFIYPLLFETSFSLMPMKNDVLISLLMGGVIGILCMVSPVKLTSILMQKMWFILQFTLFYQSFLFKSSWFSLYKKDAKGLIDSSILLSSVYFKSLSEGCVGHLINPMTMIMWLAVIVGGFIFFF